MPAERAGRRRSRWRRYFLRGLMWAAAAVAVLLLIAGRLVDTGVAREQLRRLAEDRLSAWLETETTLGAVRVDLLPARVVVEELRIGGGDGEAPLVYLPRGVVRAHVGGLTRPRVTLYEVRLERPVVELRFLADGTSNVPRFGKRRKSGGRSRWSVRVRELLVDSGELRIGQQRVPLDLRLRGLDAEVVGLGKVALRGEVRAESLLLELARGAAELGSIELAARTTDSSVELLRGVVSGPRLGGTFSGRWGWRDDRPGAVEIDAEVDAALLRQLGYLNDQLSGDLRYVGDVEWSRAGWRAVGEVRSPYVVGAGRDLRQVRAEIRADREGFELPWLEARYGQGDIVGSARFDTRQSRTAEVDLQLADVDVRRILRDQGAPRLDLAGLAHGEIRYRFSLDAPLAGHGWGRVEFTPAIPGGASDLPIGGASTLLIDSGVVAVEALRLRSGTHRFDAAGSYDMSRRRGRFRYDLRSDALPEVLASTDLDFGPAAWLPTVASGSIGGDLEIEPAGLSSRIELDLAEVVAPGLVAESVRGGFHLRPSGIENLRLDVTGEDAGLLITGTLPFATPEGTATAPLELSVDAAGWPLARLDAWLPLPLPVDGELSGALQLAGQPDAIRGSVRGTVDPAVVAERIGGELQVEVSFDPETIGIDTLRLINGACSMTASGRIGQGDGGLELSAESSGCRLDAAPFEALAPLAVAGGVEVALTLAGSLDRPRAEARLLWAQPAIGEESLGTGGDGVFDLAWANDEIRLDGEVPGFLTLSGAGEANRKGAELNVDFDVQGWDALVTAAGGLQLAELEGDARGSLHAAASAEAGWDPTVVVEMPELIACYQDRELRNLEPVQLAWRDGALEIDSIFLGDAAETSEFFVSGRAELPDGELALNLQTSVDARWLTLFEDALDVREGGLDLLANVTGTVAEPRLGGQGGIRDGVVVLPGGVLSLEGTDAVLLFYPDQMVLDQLTTRSAGGRMLASGRVSMPRAEEAIDYRFQISGRELNLRYPEGWLLRGDAELVVTSLTEGLQVEGALQLDRALYSQDVSLGLAQLLQLLFQRQAIEVEESDPLLAATQLNVVVEGDRALRVRNNLADLHGRVDLVIRGNAARPVVFGEVELERGGSLEYSGTEYTIDRGLLSFVNPYKIEPVIDLIADATTREYEVTMNLSGPLDKINASFSSDPPLADLEILSLLATGDVGAGSPGESGLNAGSFLYGQAATLIAERANNLFGFDKLRIDPLTGESGRLSAARVTVGKQLSRDVYATYSYDSSVTEEQILQIEWQIGRDLALVFTQNGDRSYAVDAQWETHF